MNEQNHSPLHNSALTELLSKDSGSRAFFSALSPELRRLLMKQDISNFQTLKSCADIYAQAKGTKAPETDARTSSAAEFTGLVPSGSDLSEEEYERYKQLGC